MISRLDSDIGEMMKLLQELNIDRRTLVIFTSDNGPHQEGGHKMEFFNSNGNLRGFKRDLYDGGIRVPKVRMAGRHSARYYFESSVCLLGFPADCLRTGQYQTTHRHGWDLLSANTVRKASGPTRIFVLASRAKICCPPRRVESRAS